MQALTPAQIMRALSRISDEYDRMTGETNPPKTAMTLSRGSDGLLGAFCNAMTASLSEGHWGGKFIRVDETTGAMAARTVVFGPDGRLVCDIDSAQLTRWRCGLMAALALVRFFGGEAFNERFSVALIGSGQTNACTFQVMQTAFGLRPGAFYVKGSPRNPTKNAHLFEGAHICEDLGAIRYCDAVIECATIRDRAEALEWSDFLAPSTAEDGVHAHPRLFVAQDSGWLFGPSFREMLPSFTDHVAQMNAHRHEPGYDWPWDVTPPLVMRDLRDPLFRAGTLPTGAVAYLTGIALADLVVALEASRC